MARPKSIDKRNAIIAATTQLIVTEGLGASTAMIARASGVSTGSLFTYFKTKTDLYNELYLELKSSMALATFHGISPDQSPDTIMAQAWANWVNWSVANTHKRRALALLHASNDITTKTRTAASATMDKVRILLEQSRANGHLRDAPLAFVVAIMNSLAEATIDFMIQDPANAPKHCRNGFEALLRILR